MLYRQKTLLAVIETFGGGLKKTDLQKLLLIFCQQAKNSYYDFFPHKFGGFSLLANQDKNSLIESGILTEEGWLRIKPQVSFFSQLDPYDQTVLHGMVERIGKLRGNALVHKTYLDYPRFACRSTILAEILNAEELDKTKATWNNDQSTCLFTIGYEGLGVDAYLAKLIFNNIVVLVDVRKNPFSYKPGFSKSNLENYTRNIGILYKHIPELGIPSSLRKSLKSANDYEKLFSYYEQEILPQQEESLKVIKTQLNKHNRVALTCFEADYHFCHRHKIIEYLQREKDFRVRIQHL